MTDLNERQQAVVERAAEWMYTQKHSRLFGTWEELVKAYPGSAEIARSEAIALLRALGPDVVLRIHSDSWIPLLPPEPKVKHD